MALFNRTEAIRSVNQWLDQHIRSSLHSHDNIEDACSGNTAVEWLLEVSAEGVEIPLLLVVDADFPYSLPRFRLHDDAGRMKYPHVEHDGRLCLAGDAGRSDTNLPVSVVANQLQEAIDLLSDNLAGLNTEDYQVDFNAYWGRESDASTPLYYELTSPGSAGHGYFFEHDSSFYVFDDRRRAAELAVFFSRGEKREPELKWCPVVSIDALPEPGNYPTSPNELIALAGISDNHREILHQTIRRVAALGKPLPVLVFGDALGELKAFGMSILPESRALHPRRAQKSSSRGFSSLDKVPINLLATRQNLSRHTSRRIDAWKTRLNPRVLQALQNSRVLVVGCGALGAPCAQKIALSGVGAITLVDHELLGWENVSRHELGGLCVGQYKSRALAMKINDHLGRVKLAEAVTTTIQAKLREDDSFLDQFDLVLMLTGDWFADAMVNDLVVNRPSTPPVIFSWMEKRACVSHAVLIAHGHGSLREVTNAFGDAEPIISAWTQGPAEPCGNSTSTFSSIATLSPQALICELALDVLAGRCQAPIHRAWRTSENRIAAEGGLWAPGFDKVYSSPIGSAQWLVRPWPREAAADE